MKKLLLLILCIVFAGCPSPPPPRVEAPPPPPPPVIKPAAPEVVVLVGSINLSKFSKKLEHGDVHSFAAVLQHDSIDILAMEGITRYPGLPDRVDIVDELSGAAGMRSSFGETMTLQGRQSGNAVFSTFPIRTSENTPYEKLHSTKLEAAFQAVIDCGTRDMVVVSTLLPENASREDQTTVINVLGTFTTYYPGHPVCVTGNLPMSADLRNLISFGDAEAIHDRTAPRFWLSNGGGVRLLGARAEKTPLGMMTVARLGLFRQTSR